MLHATTACTFPTSHLPKVLWTRQIFTLLTSKCASRHNGVQFFIFHLASWLRTRRFSEPTFRPSWATHHWKNTVFRDFPTFSRTWIFFRRRLSLFDLLSSSLLFSSLILPISAFHLSILSEVWLLNCLRSNKYISNISVCASQHSPRSVEWAPKLLKMWSTPPWEFPLKTRFMPHSRPNTFA